jgi:hypothetical protein
MADLDFIWPFLMRVNLRHRAEGLMTPKHCAVRPVMGRIRLNELDNLIPLLDLHGQPVGRGEMATALSLFRSADATLMIIMFNVGTAMMFSDLGGLFGRRMLQ